MLCTVTPYRGFKSLRHRQKASRLLAGGRLFCAQVRAGAYGIMATIVPGSVACAMPPVRRACLFMDASNWRSAFPSIPVTEIPASVPFRLVLARTDRLVLWMTNLRVYSTGIVFTLAAIQRTGDRPLGMYGFGKPEYGSTPPMLFGIEDSVGTLSTNLPRTRSGLRPGGGGGSGGQMAMNYSLTPLPAPAPMSIYVAWPYFGVGETRFEVDATPIRDAVADIITVWPAQEMGPVTYDLDNRVNPQIEIPRGGWFESTAETLKPPPPNPDAPRRINFAYLAEPREKSTDDGGEAASRD